MTIFVDASVIVAIMSGEPEADALSDAIGEHSDRHFSAVCAWEAVRAIARIRAIDILTGAKAVDSFAEAAGLRMVGIGEAEGREAIHAHDRYGKGRHLAKLNMGDCFSYACAKTSGARLLYKGDDFRHTDLA